MDRDERPQIPYANEKAVAVMDIPTGVETSLMTIVDVNNKNADYSFDGIDMLVVIPHAGLLLPIEFKDVYKKISHYWKEKHRTMDEEVRAALFRDADLYTNLIKFYSIPDAVYASYAFHRDSGDPNRSTEAPDFLRTQSFDGTNLLRESVTKDDLREAKEITKGFVEKYYSALADLITKYQERGTNKPLLMPNIHSMDKIDPDGTAGVRPDLYIVTGKTIHKLHPDIEDIITHYAKKELEYEIEILDDFEGKPGRINLIEEFGDPLQGVNPFIIEINKKHIENDDTSYNQDAFEKVNSQLESFLIKVKKETDQLKQDELAKTYHL